MKRILMPTFICSLIIAQGEVAVETPLDTTIVDSTFIADSVDTSKRTNSDFSLEYGYKGYQWGSNISNIPTLENMSIAQPDADNRTVTMSGWLGTDSVRIWFVYSDSGFWKSEIDFQLENDDLDKQIELFLRIEGNISEVYGNPFSTDQTVNGPSTSYNNFLNVKYSRAFFRSSWNISPARIVLVLNGVVQQPKTETSLLEGDIGFLRLVYYNPDFMINAKEEIKTEETPSIFEIY
ncbi:MAG: hypothetical protein ACE5D0_07990 [Fidelibacterota bacterium]